MCGCESSLTHLLAYERKLKEEWLEATKARKRKLKGVLGIKSVVCRSRQRDQTARTTVLRTDARTCGGRSFVYTEEAWFPSFTEHRAPGALFDRNRDHD